MDAAAAKKGPRAQIRAAQEARRGRKSATGMSGDPKKGGHGGKFTWEGGVSDEGDVWAKSGAMDEGDPNFEEPEALAQQQQKLGGNAA